MNIFHVSCESREVGSLKENSSQNRLFFFFLRFEFSQVSRGKHEASAERDSSATAGVHENSQKITRILPLTDGFVEVTQTIRRNFPREKEVTR